MKQNLLARFFKELKERQKQSVDAQPIDINHIAKSGILGAVIGDIVGSTVEFANEKSTKFDFYTEDKFFTDDTVMTIAVADWLTRSETRPVSNDTLPNIMRHWVENTHGQVTGVCSIDGCCLIMRSISNHTTPLVMAQVCV